MPPIRRGKYGHHTLAYWCLPTPPPEMRWSANEGSIKCDMMADEECALGGHETRNMVCCAKHHLEVPCSSCAAAAEKTKEAVAEAGKKDAEAAAS